MIQNQRKIYINKKILFLSVGYAFFTALIALIFLSWEVLFKQLLESSSHSGIIFYIEGYPMVIKISLLLLWGVCSFILSYTYLDTKFMGIFKRMDDLFKEMYHNDDLNLYFRKNDHFYETGESFNDMKNLFLTKIKKRKALVEEVKEKIQNLSDNPNQDEIDSLRAKIDEELSR